MKSKFSVLKYMIQKVYEYEKQYIYIQLLSSLLQVAMILFFVFFPSYIITLIQSNATTDTMMLHLFIALFLYFVVWQVQAFLTKLMKRKEYLLTMKFKEAISVSMMDVVYEKVEDPNYQTLKDAALYPITGRGSLYELFRMLPSIFQSIFALLGVFIVMLQFDLFYLLIIFVLTILNIMVNQIFIKKEQKEVEDDIRANKEYVYYLELINNENIAKDVRIYQQQPYFVEKIARLFDYYIGSGERQYAAQDARAGVNQIISTILTISSYAYLLYLIMEQGLAADQFILLTNASLVFTKQIYNIVDMYLSITRELLYLENYQTFIENSELATYSGDVVLDEAIHSIEFRDVYFKYPNTENYVLNGLSFVLTDKKSLSVVGANGSGKTTMIKLISKLYEPTKGTILVNGIDSKELEYESYLKALSIIFQDFKTFSFSIKENIVLDQEEDEARLMKAVEKSELAMEFHKFKNGIDTTVGKQFDEEGISLSKGQEQKLAIARSIYKDGSLMILDEPTASLDPIAEAEVYEHFRKITKDKLSIFISHRLSSCQFCDTILFLEKGVIVEAGNHGELLQHEGKYAYMFELQASKYK